MKVNNESIVTKGYNALTLQTKCNCIKQREKRAYACIHINQIDGGSVCAVILRLLCVYNVGEKQLSISGIFLM